MNTMSPVSVQGTSAMTGLGEGRIDAIRRMGGERAQEAAAREVQTALFAQLISAMRETLPDSSLLPKSPARDVYDGLFDREMANLLASNDPLGLVARLARGGATVTDPVMSDAAAHDPGERMASAGARRAYGVVAPHGTPAIGSTEAFLTADAMTRAVAHEQI
jgi:Rod binding domain-containing protein